MIFLIDVRFITLALYNHLQDNTRTYIVKAKDRNEAERKVDVVIGTYPVTDKSIIQVLRIRQALLDKNGVGEIT